MPIPYIGDGSSWHAFKPAVGASTAFQGVVNGWIGKDSTWTLIYERSIGAPTGVLVTVVSFTALTVSWDAVSDATGYRVERSLDGSTGWAEIYDGTSLSYPNTGLSDGTEYYYRVQSYVVSTDSPWSATTSDTHKVTTIKPPTLSSASLGSDATSEADLVFSDGGSVSESEIRVYLSTTSSSSGFARGNTMGVSEDPFAANTVNGTITGLSDDTTYWVKLRNYNSVAGESADSTVYSFHTDAALTAPSWFAGYPQDLSSDDTSILLRLSPLGGADTYDVYYKVGSNMGGDPETNGTFLGNFTPAQITTTYYTHNTGQSHGTVMYYNARGKIGSSTYGPFMASDASVTVEMRLPGDPTSLSSGRTGGTATLTWSAGSPANASTYRIKEYYRTSPGAGWTLNATYTDSASPSNRSIIEGRQYYWSIRAENDAGNSSYVDFDIVEYVDTPGTPTSIALNYGASSDSQLTLSWAAPVSGGTFDGYDIEYIAYASSFTGSPNDSSGNDTSEVLTSLTDDTRYKARLRATSSVWSTAGSWSAQDDEWTSPSVLSAPTLTVTATGDDTLHLESSVPADTDEYAFYTSGGSLLVQQAGATYDRSGLSANTQYGQYVKAVNTASVGSPHSDVYSSASATNNKYTLVDVPQSFSATRDTGACPTNQFDLSWSNANGDAVNRSTSGTIQRDDGSGYAGIGTFSAGATTATGVAATGTTVGFRIKYDGESTYATDSSLGPPCPE